MDPSVGHLNDILARVGGNLNNNFQKSQMPGGLPGGGGMLKLRFDRYISSSKGIDGQREAPRLDAISLSRSKNYNANTTTLYGMKLGL